MKNSNMFYRNRFLRRALPFEVCYWIINECEKHNQWKSCDYCHYSLYTVIDHIPSILSFVLFIVNFWMQQVKKMYNFDLPLDIKDAFVAKYNKSQPTSELTHNGNFLTLELQLNDTKDFRGGGVMFDGDTDEISLSQCDMMIYTGMRGRTSGSVVDGEKFVLVILFDIKT